MKYQIKYSYQTGDSFRNEDTEGIIELKWNNLDVAKENLKAIEEHYQMYEEIKSSKSHWRKKSEPTKEQILDKYKDKWWFVNDLVPARLYTNGAYEITTQKHYDSLSPENRTIVMHENYAQNCMYLKADNGKLMRQWNPWCGYFETLYSAEIVGVDNALKFEL